jgi:probable F420-dependent oxidoreductase
MKIRIGLSLAAEAEPAGFAAAVDLLERAGVDSLWLSEHIYRDSVDPFTGMAFALSRTKALKVGTGVVVLPGRHPVLVAKQLASLAGLAPKRVLPVFGLRPASRAEWAAFPVPEGQRAAVFDESLELLRALLTQTAPVTFEGKFFQVKDATVGPLPEKPLDLWLGGSAPAGLRRAGRFGDGWLGSFMTPGQAGDAVRAINRAAAEAGREVDQDHFGMNVGVAFGPLPQAYAESVARRNPGVKPGELAADGWAGAKRLIEEFAAVGVSKFVVRPVTPDFPLSEFTDAFTRELLPLQT